MAAVETRPLGALGRMGVVVGFHAALVLVLANSFGLMPKAKQPDVLIGTVIDEPPRDEPLPRQEFPLEPTDTQVYVPTPDDPTFEREAPNAIVAERILPDGIPLEPQRLVPDPIPVSGVRLDPRHPLTQPRYPAEMTRSGSQGAVEVEIYVQPDGRVGDARIVKSSGFDSFDRSTLQEARAWRLLPAMRGDEPFAQWYRLRVVFKLKNQQ